MARVILFFFALLVLVLKGCNGQSWSHREINQWATLFPACGSTVRQLPINFDYATVTTVVHPPVMTSFGYFDRALSGTLKNNGHVLQFDYNGCPEGEMDASCLWLTGGSLGTDIYSLRQFHFHWGANSSRGAEHTINGFQYPAELHLVHFNTKYADSEVLGQPDGAAVLGFFLTDQFGADTNCKTGAFETLLSAIPFVRESGSEYPINLRISDFFVDVPDLSQYFTFPGSLTTPPCSEAVTFLIFTTPIRVQSALLEEMRLLIDTGGFPLVDNYRPVQTLANPMSVTRNVVIDVCAA